MNTIRLIALDMDGTLLDDDHFSIPPRNLSALRAAAAQGIEISIASGRTWSLIEEAAGQIGVLSYALISNGAAVWDMKAGEWRSRIGMPPEQCREVIRILRAHDLVYEVFCDGCSYMERAYRPRVAGMVLGPAYEHLFQRGITLCEDVVDVLEGRVVEKFHILHVAPEQRAALIGELKDTGPLEFANGDPTNLELTAPGADKGTALAGLCAWLDIPPDAVMAFGDADNDLGMLTWAGWSFAMENGTPSAKAAAKYRAGLNRDAGVGRVVEQFLLHD